MNPRHPPAVVLVTGAAGKTGRAVIQAFLAVGLRVRALVRNADQQAVVEQLGVTQVALGDLLDDEAVTSTVRGVDAVYHVCPNMHPDEIAIGRRVLEAARTAEVRHFVFHSVLHPQTEAMPHHWAKLRVEELLLESDLAFTILQPAPYMQNILGQWARITTAGVFQVPYAATTRVAMVDLDEVATVAARVVDDPEHHGATYELCAPDWLDQTEIAAVLARHLGRPVRVEALGLADWARSTGLAPGSYRFDTLASMFRYYERYGMAGNPRVLAGLLGRPASTLSDFLARQSEPDRR